MPNIRINCSRKTPCYWRKHRKPHQKLYFPAARMMMCRYVWSPRWTINFPQSITIRRAEAASVPKEPPECIVFAINCITEVTPVAVCLSTATVPRQSSTPSCIFLNQMQNFEHPLPPQGLCLQLTELPIYLKAIPNRRCHRSRAASPARDFTRCPVRLHPRLPRPFSHKTNVKQFQVKRDCLPHY